MCENPLCLKGIEHRRTNMLTSVLIVAIAAVTAPVLVAPAECDPALELGVQVLSDALAEIGTPMLRVGEDALQELPPGSIVVGRDNKWIPKELDAANLAAESHVLRPWMKQYVVFGGDDLGDAYGAAYLAERILLNPAGWMGRRYRRSPAFSIRMASGCSAEEALRLGYNTWSSAPSPSKVATFESFDPELFDDAALARRGEDIAKIRGRMAEATALGLKTFGGGDEFQFPSEITTRPYSDDLMELSEKEEFCIASEKLWAAYRAKFQEYARDFPEIGYCVLRLGENYSHLTGGAYVGNGVYHYNGKGYCSRCESISYEERIARVVNETQALLADSSIQYMHRTWDTHGDRIHANAEVYQRILNRVPNRKDILWSIKYTQTDFWRYNFPNPCIGVGGVPQLIEFQCQREYEGKGAYPNFVGPGIAEGHRYAQEKGAEGVWHWHHGGGWGGPHLVNDFWNQANIYAAAHLAWEPNAKPADLAREWAALCFGHDAAEAVAETMMLSEEAVRKLRYFEAYCKNHRGWLPAHNWMRDDKIRGGSNLSPIYAGARGDVDEMIAEKEEALRMVDAMREQVQALKGKMDPARVLGPGRGAPVLGGVVKGGDNVFTGLWGSEKAGVYQPMLQLRQGDTWTDVALTISLTVGGESGVLNHWVSFSEGSLEGRAELPRKLGLGKRYPLRVSIAKGRAQVTAARMVMHSDGRATTEEVPLSAPQTGGNLYDHLLTSVEYEYALAETAVHYVAAYFLHRRGTETNSESDLAEARRRVGLWKTGWERYCNDIPKLPGVASLYNDDGMVETMEGIEAALSAPKGS
jgi:hypothetical protein